MEEMITSYLILNGECLLPGIGKLFISRRNAVSDVASKLLHPPEKIIQFEDTMVGDSQPLVKYLSESMECPAEEASDEMNKWLRAVKETLKQKGEYKLPFLGKIVKDDNTKYYFQSGNALNIFVPVKAERVIHDADSHDLVVGDKISNSSEMSQLLSGGTRTTGRKFWIPAIVIFSIAILIIIIYLAFNGFDLHLNAQDAPPTYISR